MLDYLRRVDLRHDVALALYLLVVGACFGG